MKKSKYNITFFEKVYKPNLQVRKNLTFKEIAEIVSRRRPFLKKKEQSCWSPASYTGSRKAENVDQVTLMTYDIDNGLRWAEVIGFLEYYQIVHFAHTTSSHSKKLNKFRVVLPIPEPVPRDKWGFVWSAAVEWWAGCFDQDLTVDEKCKDPSRAYYMGHCKEGSQYKTSYIGEGKIYPLQEWGEDAYQAHIRELSIREKLRAKKLRAAMAARPKNEKERAKKNKILLSSSRGERESLADHVGARYGAGSATAKGFDCPLCGRSDATYFYLDVTSPPQAQCGHKNSCTYRESLYDLAVGSGFIGEG